MGNLLAEDLSARFFIFMKSKLFLFAFTAAAVAASLPAGTAATPKPDVKVDRTPITAGPSGQVASYADVVEPVERAVVSIYSTKTVHQRVVMNPLLRQLFGDVPDQDRVSKE